MVYTLIDHRNDVKMFKTQVEPRAAGEWFHSKVLNIQLTSLLWSIRVKKPWKIVVYLFFTIILTVFNVHFWQTFLENSAREQEKNNLHHHCIIFMVCTLR